MRTRNALCARWCASCGREESCTSPIGGKARNGMMRAAFLVVQLLDGFETTTENVRGALPHVFAATGFEDVRQSAQFATLFGSLTLYQARKPASQRESRRGPLQRDQQARQAERR